MTDLDYEFDPETGEVISFQPMLNHPSGIFEVRTSGDDFKVNSKESAEWVLRKLLDYDIQIEAVKLRRQTINENLDNMQITIVSNRKLLLEKFEQQLQDYAIESLKEGKKKSLQLAYGKIGFREIKGSTIVINTDSAIDWLENNNMTNAVKTSKSVLVSKIPENIELPPEIFEVKQPYTKFYIDTGIK